MPRQVANRTQEQVRLGGANSVRGGERAEHSDGSHSRSPRHLDVFRGVAHVHALFRFRVEKLQRDLKRRGMRLLARRVFAENSGGECLPQTELTQLLPDAGAASSGHEPKHEASLERSYGGSRAGK